MQTTADGTTPRVSRTRWAAAGAALAVALGGGTLAFVNAADGPPSSSFVPIAPCRLLDTRPSTNVGPRDAPINASESLFVDVWGSQGNCVIPSSATAIVINVTVTHPTAQSFLTVYPADVSLPTASNLNYTAGQSPRPNLVTVSLSATGAIKFFNKNGTVNVIGDIAGYYQPNTGTANAGAACNVGGLPGVIVNGVDYEHNVSSKCFTSLVSTLAGTGPAAGASIDGIGLNASFHTPVAVAVDSVGNMYVVDQSSSLIRKVTVTGVVTIFAGSTTGFADGPALSAQFNTPSGVAVDSVGNVYVADNYNHVIRKIDAAGMVTTFAGLGETYGYVDANGGTARFTNPSGVAVDDDDNVYVAEPGNHAIRKITPGRDVTTVAGGVLGSGFVDGNGGAARFSGPAGLAVDGDGNIYVADQNNHAIRKVTQDGDVTTLAGSGVAGSANGQGDAARFDTPFCVAVDSDGNVYVADQNNHLIRKVTPLGVTTTLAGGDFSLLPFVSVDGVGGAARFTFPVGIAIDGAGTLYVVESNGWLRRIS